MDFPITLQQIAGKITNTVIERVELGYKQFPKNTDEAWLALEGWLTVPELNLLEQLEPTVRTLFIARAFRDTGICSIYLLADNDQTAANST